MSFTVGFVIWVVTGRVICWLARRSEPQSGGHPYPFMSLGIVGGVLGGLIWFPLFFLEPLPEVDTGTFPGIAFIRAFDVLTFNIFSASFGFIVAFWTLHIVRSLRDYQRSKQT
jgi:hypothetical protein